MRTSKLGRELITIPFSTEALQANLLRLRNEWETVQASRDRNAIYQYLGAVFELVSWWEHDQREIKHAHRALHLRGYNLVSSLCGYVQPWYLLTLSTSPKVQGGIKDDPARPV